MKTRGRNVTVLLVILAVAVLLVVFASNWEEIRIWYLLRGDFESIGRNAQGYSEYRHRETEIVFVRLPGGEFSMGSPDTESGRYLNEGPVHKVKLSPFLIGKYEVTAAEWGRNSGSVSSVAEGPDFPVSNVTWNDCQKFCDNTGLLLPTEAQWEMAMRDRLSVSLIGIIA